MTNAIAALLASSWRFEVSGEQHVSRLRSAGERIIYAVWHGSLLPPLWHRRRQNITLLVSAHRDGTRLAGAARRWGYRIAFGSSTRGGSSGLRSVVRALSQGEEVAFTPDGPRGPARVAKPGAVAAAQLGEAFIVPIGAAAEPAWRASSWDTFTIPRPFSRVRLVYGEPFRVPRGSAGLEWGTAHLERTLSAAERKARCSG
ncbi:MAG: lysophospholipid acyltransferase family protein [Gemmatimonadota bacterium]|nr:MAG: lysophospholipid acyltransferase family protein [Gemmatimonadota bacterium]